MDIVSRALLVAGGASEPTDPFRNQVAMLIKPESTANGDNNSFYDYSSNGFSITRNGNVAPGSFSPFGDRWSNYFGSGNYISAPSNAAFGFGTGDFTVEAWVYPDAAYTTYNYIWAAGAAGGLVVYVLGGVLYARTFNGTDLLASSTAPALHTWTHVAVTRSGTTLRIFVNGVQTGSTTNSTDFAAGPGLVGNDGTNVAPWYGYISNVRVLKGTALYTSAFSPPIAPLTAITNTSLLTCQANRLIDSSSNAFTITRNGSPTVQRFSPFAPTAAYGPTPWTGQLGASAYFDGSGDFLSIPHSTLLDLSTGSWTVEAWVYTTNAGAGYKTIVCKRASSSAEWEVGLDPSNFLYLYTGTTVSAASTAVPVNAWSHVAVSYDGTNARLFLNGQVVRTVAQTALGGTAAVVIGKEGTGSSGQFFTGYITDVRVVKGTAVYTSAFTPPTAPLTNIANTSLRVPMLDSNIWDEAGISNIECVGSVNLTDGNPAKFGLKSISFSGLSGNNLVVSGANTAIQFGSGDFTIEMWFRPSSSLGAGSGGLFGTSDGTNYGIELYLFNDKLRARVSDSSGTAFCSIDSTNNVPPGTTWSHLALTRSGNVFRLFINGALEGSQTASGTVRATSGTVRPRFGTVTQAIAPNGSASFTNASGHMDDFRITLGVARYTAAFTPPGSTFPSL